MRTRCPGATPRMLGTNAAMRFIKVPDAANGVTPADLPPRNRPRFAIGVRGPNGRNSASHPQSWCAEQTPAGFQASLPKPLHDECPQTDTGRIFGSEAPAIRLKNNRQDYTA